MTTATGHQDDPRTATWFRRYTPAGDPALRLICFPYGGGTPAVYRTWHRWLPADTEMYAVCYPGRHDRFADPAAISMEQLADAIAEAIEPLLDRPFALFGHSMGAAVAYEVAVRLERRYGAVPVRLFVSGSEAPHKVEHTEEWGKDDETALAKVRELGSSAAEVLNDATLLEFLLPTIRADFRLLDLYRPAPVPVQVGCPLVAYAGDSDPECRTELVRGWADNTRSSFEMRVFPGDHFFLEPLERELLTSVVGHLQADMRLRRAVLNRTVGPGAGTP